MMEDQEEDQEEQEEINMPQLFMVDHECILPVKDINMAAVVVDVVDIKNIK
jgi:hypothetical protein